MKPLRNNIHGTRAVILLLALISWGTAWAGVLDWFKSPVELIMNQKNCTYLNRQMPGEMINGKFIFSPRQGVVVVLISLEKLDSNRVVARRESGEDRRALVLDVKKSDGAVSATLALPDGNAVLFVECGTAGQPVAKDPKPTFARDLEDGTKFLKSKDYARAASSFRKAAEQGNASAQSRLAQMYADGRGVGRDYKQAAVWFQKAAAQGDAGAQFSLGSLYEEGKGVAKDKKQAEFWYKQAVVGLQKAAAQGDGSAQFTLGFLYEEGRGVAKDYKQAAFWYEKSAAEGNSIAMFSLHSLYSESASKDNIEAHKWATIAAAKGIPSLAEMHKVLEIEMTQAQIAEAQRRASEWLKAHK